MREYLRPHHTAFEEKCGLVWKTLYMRGRPAEKSTDPRIKTAKEARKQWKRAVEKPKDSRPHCTSITDRFDKDKDFRESQLKRGCDRETMKEWDRLAQDPVSKRFKPWDYRQDKWDGKRVIVQTEDHQQKTGNALKLQEIPAFGAMRKTEIDYLQREQPAKAAADEPQETPPGVFISGKYFPQRLGAAQTKSEEAPAASSKAPSSAVFLRPKPPTTTTSLTDNEGRRSYTNIRTSRSSERHRSTSERRRRR